MDLSKYWLLVAEDNDDTRLLISESLKKTGINLVFAVNGNEAVELFQSNPSINIVLMDAMMPEKSGFDATRQIKQINPLVPVVMLTAYVGQDSVKQAVSSGCNDYLSKPVKPSVLLSVIEKWTVGES
ncbi:MAG: response regulator [Prolixibacteraceae bacterium]|jgi:CheY-like chemotaxis protein|nr:response regulator [Prolixibacteraceae bacterium]